MSKPVIIITGANRGIGFETCRLLAVDKTFTIILTSRNKIEGQTKALELHNLGYDIHFIHLDVNDQHSIEKFISTIRKDYGTIDILVNNAGVYLDSPDLEEFASFIDVTPLIIEKTLNTNLFGPMVLIQSLLPYFNEKGLIVNISSGGGKINTTGDRSGHIAYRLSKTALNAFTKSTSYHLNDNKIKIISMCPGWVASAMGGPFAPRSLTEGSMDIVQTIKKHLLFKNGSFLYNFHDQKL